MPDLSTQPKPVVRFLFLGNPRTDRRIKNFVSLFAECGYWVEIIFATPDERSRAEVIIEGVSAKQISLQAAGGAKMFLQYDLLLKDELREAKRCDILFACELYSLNAAASAKKAGKASELFYDARELYTELPSVAKSLLKKWYWKKWEREGLKKTNLVIVTAPDDADAIRKVHHFLPPHILIRNLPKREELKPNNYLREYFSIPSEKKIFVYVGGLQQDRGLEKIIAIMPQIKEKVAFVMLGEGALLDTLQTQCKSFAIQDAVHFHPAIDSDKVIDILSSADVGISLIEQNSKSYELALPSKVFEYMLAGLPVICSPLKQVKDLFVGEQSILFADPDNANELVHACNESIKLTNDSELRKHIHDKASKDFTFESEGEVLKSMILQSANL